MSQEKQLSIGNLTIRDDATLPKDSSWRIPSEQTGKSWLLGSSLIMQRCLSITREQMGTVAFVSPYLTELWHQGWS